MSEKSETTSWVLQIKCTIVKQVVCDGCTETQAKAKPWDYAVDERELYQTDWEVEKIEANE